MLAIFKHNFKHFWIAIDQALGVIVCTLYGENGYADITLSALSWIWHRDSIRSYPIKIIDVIFFWEMEHCFQSYLSEVYRLQMSPELRYLHRKNGRKEKLILNKGRLSIFAVKKNPY